MEIVLQPLYVLYYIQMEFRGKDGSLLSKVTPKAGEGLKSRLPLLPMQPGCYIFKDSDKNILYVGKSKCLNKRVASYFRKNQDEKVSMMMKFAADVDHICTDTDIEAILLEHRLIKMYRPPYNSRMRKDKEQWYIVINKERPSPALFVSPEKSWDSGMVNIGPFTRKEYAYDALIVVSDYWNMPTCGFTGRGNKPPCLRFYIKQCIAPCSRNIDLDDYQATIGLIIKFLSGSPESVYQDINRRIQEAADSLKFEHAGYLQNQYERLLDIANYLSHIPPQLDGKKYCVFLKSRHEECFLWINLESLCAKSWMRFTSKDEWEIKSEKMMDYIKTGKSPKLPCGDFRIFEQEEGELLVTAIIEVDAIKRWHEQFFTVYPEQ